MRGACTNVRSPPPIPPDELERRFESNERVPGGWCVITLELLAQEHGFSAFPQTFRLVGNRKTVE